MMCRSINGIFYPETAFPAGLYPQRSAATPAVETFVRPCLGTKSTISGWTLE